MGEAIKELHQRITFYIYRLHKICLYDIFIQNEHNQPKYNNMRRRGIPMRKHPCRRACRRMDAPAGLPVCRVVQQILLRQTDI